jgi:hypothetical protein
MLQYRNVRRQCVCLCICGWRFSIGRFTGQSRNHFRASITEIVQLDFLLRSCWMKSGAEFAWLATKPRLHKILLLGQGNHRMTTDGSRTLPTWKNFRICRPLNGESGWVHLFRHQKLGARKKKKNRGQCNTFLCLSSSLGHWLLVPKTGCCSLQVQIVAWQRMIKIPDFRVDHRPVGNDRHRCITKSKWFLNRQCSTVNYCQSPSSLKISCFNRFFLRCGMFDRRI